MYEVNILADSLHPESDARLTTFEVTFPRFILAEVNTHRMLSRNSASSRAIPTERQIAAVKDDPFVPRFKARVQGMGVGADLAPEEYAQAITAWLDARNAAVDAAERMLFVDKSRANRLLEPFLWHTAIISATEWDNFFALRTDPGAQPEFQFLAVQMKKSLAMNTPTTLKYNEWHLPLIEAADFETHGTNWDKLKRIAVGRLARRSSYNRRDPEPDEKSIERSEILSGNGHWSPFEHVARPLFTTHKLHRDVAAHWSGNFYGWHQYRKDFPNEDNFAKLQGS